MKKFFKHLKVVFKHKYFVFINACKMGIPWIGLIHDTSKFSREEFWRSVKYFVGTDSPTNKEREDFEGFSYICAHHTGRNKHHWQYWLDWTHKDMVIMSIPYKHSVEYVCDIMAASRAYHPKEYDFHLVYRYFTKNMGSYLMHPATKEFIVWCLEEAIRVGYKGITKKITKAKYIEICAKYPKTIIIPMEDIYQKLNII